MKIKDCLLAALLTSSVTQPVFAKCESVFRDYLKDTHRITAAGTDTESTQIALVKIIAVHPDAKPHVLWCETGTLDLSRIESTGKSLPKTFSVRYLKRLGEPMDGGGRIFIDCDTWDDIAPKPSERLLAFFQPQGKGWAIPEIAAHDVAFDADHLDPARRNLVQPLFRTRL